MKVITFPQTDGCGLYRLRLPTAALQRQGYNVIGRPEGAFNIGGYQFEDGATRPEWTDIEADVVVFQRPMSRDLIEVIPIIQRQGIAVVVELDDDFHSLPKGHPAKKDSAPIHSPNRNRRLLLHACQLADMVTTSTPAIAARYGDHGRARVIRNLIPADYLNIQTERAGMFVGWTGSTRTHVDDLRVCGDAVASVLRDSGWMWRTVGTGKGVGEQLGIGDRPTDSTGWVSLDAYPREYARLDVAVAPLQLNPFNEAKSWLKVLEAAALGVPVVASPTSEYVRAAELGLCQIATDPSEWEKSLKALMGSPMLREEIAGTARAAAAGLTYDDHCHLWWEAWEQALTNHRQRRTAA